MKLEIKPDWLLRMAQLEDGRIISVGGWVARQNDNPKQDSEESAENAA